MVEEIGETLPASPLKERLHSAYLLTTDTRTEQNPSQFKEATS